MGEPRTTAEQRKQVLALHKQGMGRNQIARELKFAPARVSKIVADAGLTFDRAMNRAATEARRDDVAERRTYLELQLLEDAEKLRAQAFEPHEYIDHGGKDFIEVRWTQPEPSPADKLKLMQAAGIAVDRSLKIAGADVGHQTERVRSLVDALAEGFGLKDQPEAEAPDA